MTNLNLYKCFCVVAEEKNISKASEILYISQPAVSFSIKELEKEDFNKVLRIIRDLKPLEQFDYNLLSSKDEKLAEKCTDSLHLSVQISSVLASQINGNPRQCKRFLNMLFMRIQMAKSRKVDLDKKLNLTDGKIDAAKLKPICYDPVSHNYNVLGEVVGKAFSEGKAIK